MSPQEKDPDESLSKTLDSSNLLILSSLETFLGSHISNSSSTNVLGISHLGIWYLILRSFYSIN